MSGFKRYVRREHKMAFEEECFKLTGSSGKLYFLFRRWPLLLVLTGTDSDNEDLKLPKIPKVEPSHSKVCGLKVVLKKI